MPVDELVQPQISSRSAAGAERRGGPGRALRRSAGALAALLASLVLYTVTLVAIPATGDEDAALHAVYTRFPSDPSRLLSIWSRPLFALPYLIPAQLGYPVMRGFTVLICAVTAWLTFRIAARIGLPRAWAAVPLVLLQPALFGVGNDTMTEPIFALVLAGGLLAHASGRLLLAAAVWSFLPLGRPEGPFILALLLALWLPGAVRSRRYRAAILLLGLGLASWELLCWLVTRDPAYLIHTFPWEASTSPVHGTPWHYVRRWPLIIGWGLLPLWLAGLRRAWSHPTLRLCVLMTGAVLALHTVLFTLGKMDSWGFDRYFATIAPAIALVGVAGLRELGALAPRVMTPVLGVLLVLQGWQALSTLLFHPMTYVPAATRDALAELESRIDLRGRPVLTADRFGYVFLDDDWGLRAVPVGPHEVTSAAIARLPRGTVVLWDDMVGDWWFHLSVADFTARGYRLLWERDRTLGASAAIALERVPLLRGRRLYPWLDWGPTRSMHQAVLVRE